MKTAIWLFTIFLIIVFTVIASNCSIDENDDDDSKGSSFSPENCDYVCEVLFKCDSTPPPNEQSCLDKCTEWLGNYSDECRACVINCLHVWEDTSCDENEYNNCLSNSCSYYNCV